MDFSLPLKVKNTLFKVATAVTPGQQSKGLSGVSLQPNTGMLFIYGYDDKRAFWMKDCTEPLDILFLDAKGRIVDQANMVPEDNIKDKEASWDYQKRLKLYTSKYACRYALELPANTIKELNIKVGDQVNL